MFFHPFLPPCFSAWDNLLLCPLICFSDKTYSLVYWGLILSKFPQFAYLLINFEVNYFSHVRSNGTLSWVCSFQRLWWIRYVLHGMGMLLTTVVHNHERMKERPSFWRKACVLVKSDRYQRMVRATVWSGFKDSNYEQALKDGFLSTDRTILQGDSWVVLICRLVFCWLIGVWT